MDSAGSVTSTACGPVALPVSPACSTASPSDTLAVASPRSDTEFLPQLDCIPLCHDSHARRTAPPDEFQVTGGSGGPYPGEAVEMHSMRRKLEVQCRHSHQLDDAGICTRPCLAPCHCATSRASGLNHHSN